MNRFSEKRNTKIVFFLTNLIKFLKPKMPQFTIEVFCTFVKCAKIDLFSFCKRLFVNFHESLHVYK